MWKICCPTHVKATPPFLFSKRRDLTGSQAVLEKTQTYTYPVEPLFEQLD